MKLIQRIVTLSLGISLGIAGCAPSTDASGVQAVTQAGVVMERVSPAPPAEDIDYRFSVAVRGDGLLLTGFELQVVNHLPGAVLFDQSAETNAMRRSLAEGLVATSPRSGLHYYDADSVAAGEAILRDLANQSPELITVTFARTDEGDRVTVACRGGQAPWVRVFSPAEMRDPGACVEAILVEVQRQVDVFRTARP
jgi:hypothetical protein